MLSIVTVNFNNASGLKKTAASISNLHYRDFEWIVIDGKSTDSSLSVLKKFSPHKLLSESDKGIYDAMNKGINLSAGRWIIFMNAGDEFVDGGCLNFLTGINANNELIHGDALCVDVDGGKSFYFSSRINSIYSFVRQNPFCHQSLIYNLEALKSVIGFYDLKYPISADFDLTYRYFKVFGAIRIHSVIARFELGGVGGQQRYRSLLDRLRSLSDRGPFHVYLLTIISLPYWLIKFSLLSIMQFFGVLWAYRALRDFIRGYK